MKKTILSREDLKIATEWYQSLLGCDWHRGRIVASKQAKVLVRLIEDSKRHWDRVTSEYYASMP